MANRHNFTNRDANDDEESPLLHHRAPFVVTGGAASTTGVHPSESTSPPPQQRQRQEEEGYGSQMEQSNPSSDPATTATNNDATSEHVIIDMTEQMSTDEEEASPVATNTLPQQQPPSPQQQQQRSPRILRHSSTTRTNLSINTSTRQASSTALDKNDALHHHHHHASSYDDSLLHRTIADAGRWAYGVVLVELWVLSDDRTVLFRPESGWWIDPVYHNSSSCDCTDGNCALCRLVDKKSKQYCPPDPVCPGEGLPGALWSDARDSGWFGSNSHNSHRGGFVGSMWGHHHHHRRQSETATVAAAARLMHVEASSPDRVVWRHFKPIAEDPDQPYNLRMQLLASLDLGWVAAVPFRMHGAQGIFIYMAREGVDIERLRSPSNELYLMSASDLAAAAYAFRGPRQQIVQERRAELKDVMRRVRIKILVARKMGKSLSEMIQEQEKKKVSKQSFSFRAQSRLARDCKRLQEKAQTMMKKCRGGGAQLPPVFSWKETILTFVGVFLTLLAITRLNVFILSELGSQYFIVLGPFGALMTLQYGLTAAPAAQPRNALAGQAVSISIALAVSCIDNMEVWMKQSLATGLAVATMVKLGITHPPAGASALLFSTPQGSKWGTMLFMLVGNMVAVIMATIINNYSDKRQYPSYWGVPYFHRRGDVEMKKKL